MFQEQLCKENLYLFCSKELVLNRKSLIQEYVSLKDKNWFNTGGNARYFCQPTTIKEFQEALLWSHAEGIPVEVLGKGANCLISDEGYDGLIINPALTSIELVEEVNSSIDDEKILITAHAGVDINACIDWALGHNLIGLEEFSGIPGTIGGAVYINIHYFNFFLSDYIVKATIINKKTGTIKTVPKDWFQFSYDQSELQKKEWLLLSATFALTKATNIETAYARGRKDEMIRQRNSRYPTEKTCGSFFRNFHKHELTSEQTLPFIAYYLDKIGIKGVLKYGDAIVSYKHANMIVNKGNATSHDIVMLARKMQALVYEKFGLIPQLECQFIGFKTHPLETLRFHRVESQHDTAPSIEP